MMVIKLLIIAYNIINCVTKLYNILEYEKSIDNAPWSNIGTDKYIDLVRKFLENHYQPVKINGILNEYLISNNSTLGSLTSAIGYCISRG